jgi:ankyrin repeat protein
MTDPFSIATRIEALIQLADFVVEMTWPMRKKVENQTTTFSKLLSNIASLTELLPSIRLVSQRDQEAITHEEILECQIILEDLRDRLEYSDSGSSDKGESRKKLESRLYFPYEKDELKDILERLGHLRSTFELAIATTTTEGQANLELDFRNHFQKSKHNSLPKHDSTAKSSSNMESGKALKFFDNFSPEENHTTSMELRHNETGSSFKVDPETMLELWTAAQNDEADDMKSLVEKLDGVKINIDDRTWLDVNFESVQDGDSQFFGMNALHFAASAGSYDCIRVLLDAGADLHHHTKDGSTALHFAAGSQSLRAKQCVAILVDAGISLNEVNDDGLTVLHFAAISGHPATVEFLLENYFNPYPTQYSEQTIDMVSLLLSYRSVMQHTNNAINILELAVHEQEKSNNSSQFYQQVVEHDADLALTLTPYFNDIEIMDEVHWRLSGWLTIHFAIVRGDLELVKILLERGSDFWEVTKEWDVESRQLLGSRLNCLHVAAQSGKTFILEYILQVTDIPVDCLDGDGGTALHLAAIHRYEDCTRVLLAEGADVRTQDHYGNSPLHYAVASKSYDVVRLLIDDGSPILVNLDFRTPTDLAIQSGDDEMADLLRNYQAFRIDIPYRFSP